MYVSVVLTHSSIALCAKTAHLCGGIKIQFPPRHSQNAPLALLRCYATDFAHKRAFTSSAQSEMSIPASTNSFAISRCGNCIKKNTIFCKKDLKNKKESCILRKL